MFTHKKASQIAAYLAAGIRAPRINYMRLIKLMYLADRESLSRFGEPISYDQMSSMNNGLVLSQTYDVIKIPERHAGNEAWAEYFSPRKNKEDYFIGVRRPVSRGELDQLSDADITILDHTLATFGKLNQWRLSQYMHDHCAEWEFPDGSSIPVNEEKLLRTLGFSDDEAAATALSLQGERQMNRIFRRR